MINSPLDLMVHKLSSRSLLSEADQSAILTLPYVLRTYKTSSYIVREGEAPRAHSDLIHSGFAYRHKLTAYGARQIVSLHLRGDFVDVEHLFLNVADHNVQALTDMKVIGINREALQAVALERPAVGRAMWVDALINSSIYREWVTNVGRRDARARISHVLCEFALRMKAAGMATDRGYELPFTQEQLADVVGLTPVHVSRTLKSLEEDGIVYRTGRFISFGNWNAVSTVADFSPLYLHLNEAVPQPAQLLAG